MHMALLSWLSNTQNLSGRALDQTRRYLRNRISKLYAILCEPLQRLGNGWTIPTTRHLLLLLMFSTFKVSAPRGGCGCCAVRWASFRKRRIRKIFLLDPPWWTGESSRMWDIMVRIRQILQESGWKMPPGIVLWVAAVRYLTCRDPDVKERYQQLLRFEADELRISSMAQLRRILDDHLSLEPIRTASDSYLWAAIKGQRSRA